MPTTGKIHFGLNLICWVANKKRPCFWCLFICWIYGQTVVIVQHGQTAECTENALTNGSATSETNFNSLYCYSNIKSKPGVSVCWNTKNTEAISYNVPIQPNFTQQYWYIQRQLGNYEIMSNLKNQSSLYKWPSTRCCQTNFWQSDIIDIWDLYIYTHITYRYIYQSVRDTNSSNAYCF